MSAENYVQAFHTPVTPLEACSYIFQAHVAVFGTEPEPPLLAMLVAQSAGETLRWKDMFCWDWGNISGHGAGGKWMLLRGAGETVNGHNVPRGGTEADAFAVWPDALSGAKALVSFLGLASHPPTPNRYQAAWDAAKRGDVAGYVLGLHNGGYMTATVPAYTRLVQAQYDWVRSGALVEFLAGIAAQRGDPTRLPPPPRMPSGTAPPADEGPEEFPLK